jgi:hypothetical protein
VDATGITVRLKPDPTDNVRVQPHEPHEPHATREPHATHDPYATYATHDLHATYP